MIRSVQLSPQNRAFGVARITSAQTIRMELPNHTPNYTGVLTDRANARKNGSYWLDGVSRTQSDVACSCASDVVATRVRSRTQSAMAWS